MFDLDQPIEFSETIPGEPDSNLEQINTITDGLNDVYQPFMFGASYSMDKTKKGYVKVRFKILQPVIDPNTDPADVDVGEFEYPIGTPISVKKIAIDLRTTVEKLLRWEI
ncbi:MAG: hypothetical protein HOO67_04590 [Candidatus Peribacteraceae bacterium]|nr:hypothetical protein [Candidatus Peribacteraceae bacterium]